MEDSGVPRLSSFFLEARMKEERANEIGLDSDAVVTDGSDNRPGYINLEDPQSRASERSVSEATVEDTGEQPLQGRKAGGPRTPDGKQSSKLNALKHGIFSKAILLKNESQSEFNSLVNGLLNDL